MISMAFGVFSFLWFWFSVITRLTKALPTGATWLLPCLSPSSPPLLTISECILCLNCKESSWRGTDFPGRSQVLVRVSGCRLTWGHTLTRELPACESPQVPLPPCLTATQKRLTEDMGHHFLFLLNHFSLSFYP